MSKLQLNDDGTITIPLRNGDAITLEEPSISQLAKMTGYATEADAELPPVPRIPQRNDGEQFTAEEQAQLLEAQEVLRKRTEIMYSEAAPYGVAVVRMIKLLAVRDVTLDELPGWVASPQTCRAMLSHWQLPLVGEG